MPDCRFEIGNGDGNMVETSEHGCALCAIGDRRDQCGVCARRDSDPAARASGTATPRGSKTWRSRKKPVSWKPVENIGRIRRPACEPLRKAGKHKQLVAIGFAGAAAHGPRRSSATHRSRSSCAARRGTAREVEAEAQFIEKPHFPAHQQCRPDVASSCSASRTTRIAS